MPRAEQDELKAIVESTKEAIVIAPLQVVAEARPGAGATTAP